MQCTIGRIGRIAEYTAGLERWQMDSVMCNGEARHKQAESDIATLNNSQPFINGDGTPGDLKQSTKLKWQGLVTTHAVAVVTRIRADPDKAHASDNEFAKFRITQLSVPMNSVPGNAAELREKEKAVFENLKSIGKKLLTAPMDDSERIKSEVADATKAANEKKTMKKEVKRKQGVELLDANEDGGKGPKKKPKTVSVLPSSSSSSSSSAAPATAAPTVRMNVSMDSGDRNGDEDDDDLLEGDDDFADVFDDHDDGANVDGLRGDGKYGKKVGQTPAPRIGRNSTTSYNQGVTPACPPAGMMGMFGGDLNTADMQAMAMQALGWGGGNNSSSSSSKPLLPAWLQLPASAPPTAQTHAEKMAEMQLEKEMLMEKRLLQEAENKRDGK